MKAGKPIRVKITGEEILPQNIIDELKEDLIINVQLLRKRLERLLSILHGSKARRFHLRRCQQKERKPLIGSSRNNAFVLHNPH
ncbi:MAG: hypothetical protein ACUVTD_07690 [Nitrososphaerales archaeon]